VNIDNVEHEHEAVVVKSVQYTENNKRRDAIAFIFWDEDERQNIMIIILICF
jgi:hypothetical protein